MDWLTVLNTSVGLMSLVLGGFAIALSVYFYDKAKNAERETAKALEAIRAQSDALQRLTGKWMDRFTRHATEPKPADEGLLTLVSAVANLPTLILTHLRVQPESGDPGNEEALRSAVVDGYIALYYYTALANVASQALLPPEEDFDPGEPRHGELKRIVDSSAADFDYMARTLQGIHGNRLASSPYVRLLTEARDVWRPIVRNTDGVYTLRKHSAGDGGPEAAGSSHDG